MPENKVWYLGVDPGSAKTGFAWVEADGRIKTVSYTHLDVYKRQGVDTPEDLAAVNELLSK